MLCSARHRQPSFDSGTTVFWALAFEAVRQQHHQTAQSIPFVFGAGDELIDDHLGTVPEVTELGFPNRQTIGQIQRIAILKSQHAGFAERAVVKFQGELGRCCRCFSGV